MSVSDTASRAAHQASAEAAPWIRRLARAGYAANGAVYILVGVLAAAAAVDARSETEGSKGALASVVGAPFGSVLLLLAAIGLLGYAVWRIVQAWKDPDGRGSDAKGLARRAGVALSGITYTALAVEAFRLSRGGTSSGDGAAADWTARAMALPFGRLAVGVAGVGVIGYGIYQIAKGVRSDVCKRLDLSSLDTQARGTVEWVARFGLCARGVVFGIIGVFLAVAAWQHQAAEARGIGGALQSLEGQPFGPALLATVAAGLVAYGVFQVVKARYRIIQTS